MGTIQVSYLFPYPSLHCLSKPSFSTTSTLRLQLSWFKTTHVKKMPSRQLRSAKSWYLENNRVKPDADIYLLCDVGQAA